MTTYYAATASKWSNYDHAIQADNLDATGFGKTLCGRNGMTETTGLNFGSIRETKTIQFWQSNKWDFQTATVMCVSCEKAILKAGA